MQCAGLTERLRKTGIARVVIGVSGGLDSTLALLVAAAAMDELGRPRSDILGISMPGFGTSSGTRASAEALMRGSALNSARSIFVRLVGSTLPILGIRKIAMTWFLKMLRRGNARRFSWMSPMLWADSCWERPI